MNFVVDDRFRTRFRTLRPSSPDPPRAPRGPKEPQGPSLGPHKGILRDPRPLVQLLSKCARSYSWTCVVHYRLLLKWQTILRVRVSAPPEENIGGIHVDGFLKSLAVIFSHDFI